MIYLIKTDLRPFSAAHRLVKGYQGKCAHLHGHDYRVALTIGAPSLNAMDFVVDFDDVKKVCDVWVQKNVDHATLVCSEDEALLVFLKKHAQRHYVLPNNRNTTAESIAMHFYDVFTALWDAQKANLNPNAFIHAVEVWESAKSGAIVTRDNAVSQGVPCGI